MTGGDVDEKAHTVGAVFLAVLDAEQVTRMKQMQADFGKTWTAGKITAINDLTLTVERPDKKTQTITVDENTSFRNIVKASPSADIKVGDTVSSRGALQNGNFVATELSMVDPRNRPGGGPGGEGPNPDHGSAAAAPNAAAAAVAERIFPVPRLLSFSLFVVVSATCLAQTPPSTTPAVAPAQTVQAGGTIHGTVKSGTTPLPGVSITATNTLTGKKYSTVTDATGAYSLAIPQNGRYVSKQILPPSPPPPKKRCSTLRHTISKPTSYSRSHRAPPAGRLRSDRTGPANPAAVRRQRRAEPQPARRSSRDLIQAGGANSGSDAQLPSLANNSDFSSESVAVSGQSGTTNPFAGIDFNQMRQNMDDDQFQQSLSQTPGAGSRGGGQVETVPSAVEVLAAAQAVVEAAEEEDSADAATSATSNPISPMEPSSGMAATPRSTPSRSRFAEHALNQPAMPVEPLRPDLRRRALHSQNPDK